MIHDPKTVANEFINRGIQENNPLTHIEVQKLLYFSHGWVMGIHGRPLHYGLWEAWRYGPVLPEVYFNLNHHRGKPIKTTIKDAPVEPFSEEEKAIMDVVYGYRSLGTFALVGISHSKDGPWYQTWHIKGDSAIISNEIIQSYFAGLVQHNEA